MTHIDMVKYLLTAIVALALLSSCDEEDVSNTNLDRITKERIDGQMHALLDSCNAIDKNYEIAREGTIADSVGSTSLYSFSTQMADVERYWMYGKIKYATRGLKIAVDNNNKNYVDAFYEELAAVNCRYLGYGVPELDSYLKSLEWMNDAIEQQDVDAIVESISFFANECELMDIRGFGNTVVAEKLVKVKNTLPANQFYKVLSLLSSQYIKAGRANIATKMIQLVLNSIDDEELSYYGKVHKSQAQLMLTTSHYEEACTNLTNLLDERLENDVQDSGFIKHIKLFVIVILAIAAIVLIAFYNTKKNMKAR
ncbi:MAG: hypothetical protein K6E54_03265 [Bacteroidaceae bacterium]|nr:hypothetical protein [Bacteroidaceae bacterium]